MKNYLIVGGSSGIGKATALTLTDQGHQIYATHHSTPLSSTQDNLHVYPLDITSESIELSFLPDTLDGIVYCPGSINLKPFLRIKPEEFTKDFNLQVTGAIKVIQACLPKLKKSSQASIVLFSTVAVQHGFNFHSQVSASKGAIEGLTRALAAEFAPSIRVNAIAPSLTNTPLAKGLLGSEEKIKANADRHPLKKIGEPEDIAEAVSFLLSDKSSWITGQIMPIDGGMSSIRS